MFFKCRTFDGLFERTHSRKGSVLFNASCKFVINSSLYTVNIFPFIFLICYSTLSFWYTEKVKGLLNNQRFLFTFYARVTPTCRSYMIAPEMLKPRWITLLQRCSLWCWWLRRDFLETLISRLRHSLSFLVVLKCVVFVLVDLVLVALLWSGFDDSLILCKISWIMSVASGAGWFTIYKYH